jgi:antitoxin MazE
MRTRIQKWGHSLAVRIPRPFADEAGMVAGTEVDLSLSGRRLVVAPVAKPRFTLEQLLRKVTRANRHGETDTGAAVGRESW